MYSIGVQTSTSALQVFRDSKTHVSNQVSKRITLPMTLHEKFVEQIKVKPDETRSVFNSMVYEANLNDVLVKFFPKVQARNSYQMVGMTF
jgi:hypothetical protein